MDISGSSDLIFETNLVVCFLEYPNTSNAEIASSISLGMSSKSFSLFSIPRILSFNSKIIL